MSADFGDLEQQYNLPSGLLSAVQNKEDASGDPNAVSSAGAIGTFQFEPATAKQYGIDPTDPDQAAKGAAMMFSDLSKKYNGDVPSMLAAYNWGQGNLDRQGMKNAPQETQDYINNILPKLGKQYAQANTGSMTDATVDGKKEITDPDLLSQLNAPQSKEVTDPALLAQLNSEEKPQGLIDVLKNQPESQFYHNLGQSPNANFPNVKEEGNLIPREVTYNPDGTIDSTRVDIMAPLRHFSTGIGDLYQQAENQSTETTPAAVNSMVAMSGMPAAARGIAGAAESVIPKSLSDLLADEGSTSGPISNIVKSIKGDAVPPPIPSGAVRTASQNAYKYSNNVGGVLHPDTFTNDIMDIVDAARPQPLPSGKFTSEQNALNTALNDFSNERGHAMTLDQYENFDKALTAKESAAMDGFKPTNNSRIIGSVQDAIRDRLKNLQQSDVIGGKEGFDALTQHAIPLWSTQTKMSDLEMLINKANGSANPTQAMKTSLNNLINSPKFNNYPKIAQDAIKKAAQRGNGDDLMGIVGSRLNAIMGNTIAGKATNMVTSTAMRNVRDSMQNAKAAKIMSAMTEPVRGSVEKFSTVPELPSNYVKPEIPAPKGNPYINESSTQLSKSPSNAEFSLEGKPEIPAPKGEASDYFIPEGHAKGGIIKNREIHLSKKLEVKLGRKPKAREVELASYVGAHGVHRLMNQKDISMPAHKMFPEETVKQKRELFFNKKKPYTVEQIQKALT